MDSLAWPGSPAGLPPDPTTQGSIEFAARQCRESLQECTRIPSLTTHEWAENRLAEFSLWTAMTGALAGAAASLDSRLAMEKEVKSIVVGVLVLLSGCLDKCQQYALFPDEDEEDDKWWESNPKGMDASQVQDFAENIPRGFSPWSDDSSSDADHEPTLEGSHTSVSQLMEAKIEVEQIIDHLTRLALAIRKSGNSSRLHKADKLFNPERYYRLRGHLELVILAKGSEEGREGYSIDTGSLTPIQERLIRANLRRRNRYVYAQRHAKKLAVDAFNPDYRELLPAEVNLYTTPERKTTFRGSSTKETITAEGTKKPSKDNSQLPSYDAVLTATSASKVAHTIELIPQRAPTPSRIAKTNITTTAAKVLYPRPPRQHGSLRYFKCPCCAQTLPELFREKTMWKKHLMADICPYTCILDDCPKPERLYVTRNDWERHVKKEHQQCWQCTLCTVPGKPPLVFPSVDSLLGHLRQFHSATVSGDQHSTLIVDGARPVPPGISSCPLCDSTGPPDSPELLDHLAEHLHAFSLRSLPWAVTSGSVDEGSSDGDVGDDYLDDEDYFDQGSDEQSRLDDPDDSDQDTDGLASLSSHAISAAASHDSVASTTNTVQTPTGTSSVEETQPAGEATPGGPRIPNLRVTVIAADGLINRDIFRVRKPDPFAVVTVNGDQTKTTTAQKGTLNPYWNEGFDFHVNEDSRLAIQIFDQRQSKKKDNGFLGAINVRVGDVMKHFPSEEEQMLTRDLKKSVYDIPVKGNLIIKLEVDHVIVVSAARVDLAPQPISKHSPFEDDQGRLPWGWERRETNTGRWYYVNHRTKTTSWERPEADDSVTEVTGQLGDLPYGYEQRFTPEGRPYYVNHNDQITSWTDPRESADTAGTENHV